MRPAAAPRAAALCALLLALAAAPRAQAQAQGLPALVACLGEAGVDVIDGSDPEALRAAAATWNLAHDAIPLAVAQPDTTEGVAKAVNCTRQAGLQLTARAGGHSYIGASVKNGTVTLDLRRLNGTQVADDQQTARVGGGTAFGQLYYAVYNQTGAAKAAVGGSCPTVGVGGNFLGGGIGFLSRTWGLACDNVEELTMVTAAGQTVVASRTQNADLLAASCGGGGGNFGIVTEYKIRLHDIPPNITIATFEVAAENALDFLEFFQSSWTPSADPRMGLVMVKIKYADGHIKVYGQWLGPADEAAAALAADGVVGPGAAVNATNLELNEMSWIDSVLFFAGYPLLDTPEKLADTALVEANYRDFFKLKSFMAVEEVPADALQAMLEWPQRAAQAAPTVAALGGWIQFDMLGPKSAVAQVPGNATGYPHRSALFDIQYGAEWTNASYSSEIRCQIDELQAELGPYFPGKPGYVNYLSEDISAAPSESYYGANAGWLSQVKAAYDPQAWLSTNPLSIPLELQPPLPPAPKPAPASAAAGLAAQAALQLVAAAAALVCLLA